ncbi:metal-dependent hydrolase [Flexibacterium corallicola]|uniref:metal-dependent hydrolase n=1 Tax=Flexibacterium corallicola TaxID=3037259 RepID=UPI00286F790A|nr:metal-dependent hydrolase [Pseudovibrio sp. M1P-2-3]
MKITYWGHSAFRIEIKDAVILIDPFLSGNPHFPKDKSVEQVSSGVTHVLLSHGHDDHLGDALDILKNTGAQLSSCFEVCMWASSHGIESINPMGCGGRVDVGPFKVALTNAVHSSSSQAETGTPIYMGNPNGLIIEAEGEPTLYHMGDTDIFGDMALINELYAPKVGLVPIGDRFTMGANTAAMACKRYFNFKQIIPMHYATFPILDQSADAYVKHMEADAKKVSVLALADEIEVSC